MIFVHRLPSLVLLCCFLQLHVASCKYYVYSRVIAMALSFDIDFPMHRKNKAVEGQLLQHPQLRVVVWTSRKSSLFICILSIIKVQSVVIVWSYICHSFASACCKNCLANSRKRLPSIIGSINTEGPKIKAETLITPLLGYFIICCFIYCHSYSEPSLWTSRDSVYRETEVPWLLYK